MTHASTFRLTGKVVALAIAALTVSASDVLAQKKGPTTFNIIPINVTSVSPQGGQLVASGNVGSTPFQLPLILTAQPLAPGATCPVLNLSLGPINLSLLGLNVNTSPICLEITAHQGGGLLGDLLCDIANLLNSGEPLGTILGGLTAVQLSTIDTGLTTVLNQVLDQATSSNAFVGATCPVLHLAVGPLNLNLLGLEVNLDDCSGGPVTVDITATQNGGLLGQLLCSLSDISSGPRPNTNAILTLLRQIAAEIGRLIG